MKVTDEMATAALQIYKSLETRDMVRDLLRASAKEDSWIVEAEDSVPAYNEQVLIKVSYKPEVLLGAYYNIDGWRGAGGHIYNTTHWQPLPFSFDEYLMKLAIKTAMQAAWVGVGEHLPEHGTVVLNQNSDKVRCSGGVWTKLVKYTAEDFLGEYSYPTDRWCYCEECEVTHWMPLPEL